MHRLEQMNERELRALLQIVQVRSEERAIRDVKDELLRRACEGTPDYAPRLRAAA